MSSNNTNASDGHHHHHNRVSLGAADASRKRKKQNEREDEPVLGVPTNDKDIIKSIVTKRLWSDDRDEVANAMSSLSDLLLQTNNNSIENAKFAYHRGAPLAIAKAMNRHANCPKIQKDGIRSLANICGHCDNIEETEQTIIDTGGMQRCLLSMKQHFELPLLQAYGCCLIGNLWFRPNGVRKFVFDAGGLTAVLKAMKTRKDINDAAVQCYGCEALYSLVRTESTFIAAVVDADGIEAVIGAMEKHPTSADLQLYACLFLSALAESDDDYCTSIIGAKGLTAVAEARRIHHDKNNVVRAAEAALKVIIP